MEEKEFLNSLPIFLHKRDGSRLTKDEIEKFIAWLRVKLNCPAPKRSFPKRGKCACGGCFQDWHSHASECIVINPKGKDFGNINIAE